MDGQSSWVTKANEAEPRGIRCKCIRQSTYTRLYRMVMKIFQRRPGHCWTQFDFYSSSLLLLLLLLPRKTPLLLLLLKQKKERKKDKSKVRVTAVRV